MTTLTPKQIAGLQAAYDYLDAQMDDYADAPERTPKALGRAYWAIVDLLQAADANPKEERPRWKMN